MKNQGMGAFKFEVGPHQFNLKMQHFSMLEKKKDFQKLAGLWLAGEVVNHIGIYRSKAAEGLSAFQRQSCIILTRLIWFGTGCE